MLENSNDGDRATDDIIANVYETEQNRTTYTYIYNTRRAHHYVDRFNTDDGFVCGQHSDEYMWKYTLHVRHTTNSINAMDVCMCANTLCSLG